MPGPVPCFVAKPLTTQQIDRAYPLAHLVAPDLTLDRWRRFAGAMTRASPSEVTDEGIIALEGARGYLFGLFNYINRLHLLYGPTLRVDGRDRAPDDLVRHFHECGGGLC